jgi:hypothetical protein
MDPHTDFFAPLPVSENGNPTEEGWYLVETVTGRRGVCYFDGRSNTFLLQANLPEAGTFVGNGLHVRRHAPLIPAHAAMPVGALEADAAALREALVEAEWQGRVPSSCPVCGAHTTEGHRTSCLLGTALSSRAGGADLLSRITTLWVRNTELLLRLRLEQEEAERLRTRLRALREAT